MNQPVSYCFSFIVKPEIFKEKGKSKASLILEVHWAWPAGSRPKSEFYRAALDVWKTWFSELRGFQMGGFGEQDRQGYRSRT